MGERGVLLRLANSLRALLGLGQRAANRARLLRAEVERQVLAPRLRFTQRLELVLTDNRQRLRNRKTHTLDLAQLARGTVGDLSDAQRRELLLVLLERLHQLALGLRTKFMASKVNCVR